MSTAVIRTKVVRKHVEALDVFSFELESAEGKPLPAFSAGSHVDVRVAENITRQYSLCNDPDETHRYRIGVLKDAASRGGSKHMHEAVNVGDIIEISAPKNHFALVHAAKKSLLFAGGIGITPILCMAQRLAKVDSEFELHYCTRSQDRTAVADEMRTSGFASAVHFHFDDDKRLDIKGTLAEPTPGTHIYVCGPKGFMDAVLSAAREAGWPEEQLHYEFFGAEVAKSNQDESFEVKLASSGRVIVIDRDKTVVQALAAAGVEVQVSCEQGVCGTCLTRVIEGTPDHRDMYLTPDEQARNDQFTPCCSRARSSCLVLDL